MRQIWFKLYPNLYKIGTPRQSNISPRDLGEGVSIDSVWINGQLTNKALIGINGTNMTVSKQSVANGANIKFRISYHYTLNKTSHIRTGEVEPNAHGYADFAIASVVKKGANYNITVTTKGTKPVPADLTITYADGTVGKAHRSIAVWEKGATSRVITIPATKNIHKVVLGRTWVPDGDKKDNVYTAK